MQQTLRIIALLLLLPLVAGFGLCGMFGVVTIFTGGIAAGLLFSGIGLTVAMGLAIVCRDIFRALRDREP
jgi:hypothetical protein